MDELTTAIHRRKARLENIDISDLVLSKVRVLLTVANVPANFSSQVNKPTSVDPDESVPDQFPCPIHDFSESTVTRLNERTRSVLDVFPALTKGQLNIVVQ